VAAVVLFTGSGVLEVTDVVLFTGSGVSEAVFVLFADSDIVVVVAVVGVALVAGSGVLLLAGRLSWTDHFKPILFSFSMYSVFSLSLP
jgi:hypothetical protein